jgi:hypothetical protein
MCLGQADHEEVPGQCCIFLYDLSWRSLVMERRHEDAFSGRVS